MSIQDVLDEVAAKVDVMRVDAAGYDTQVFEFIALEHTSKNKMVLAVRRAQPLSDAQQQVLHDQVQALKAFYGVTQHALETMLDVDPARTTA
mgnify:CR=1 FL=1